METKLIYDYHTHTVYSHGRGTILENAQAASLAGLKEIGIADHGPGHIGFGISMKQLPNMRRDIESARTDFPDIKVWLNVEANIINPSGNLDVKGEDISLFDHIIAGYHFGIFDEAPIKAAFTHIGNAWHCLNCGTCASLRNRNTDLVIKALEKNDIFILSHPGSKAEFDLRAIAKCCAARGTLMEINNHHDGLSVEGIRIAAEEGAGLVISSDAHRPCNVGTSDEAIKRAKEAGIDSSLIVNLREDARWN